MKNDVANRREAGDRRSIGEVVALLAAEYPDVTPSSLRFLEREGLVVPERTPGGHRLYPPAQVERVRRIKAWQRERLSLAEIRARLAAAARLPAPAALATAFLEAALAGDTREARRLVLEAHDAGLPLARLYTDVLRPALYEVGQRWEAGHLAVAQEHEISALVRDVVGELSARYPGPAGPAGAGGVIVAACVPGEAHDLGLRMVAGLYQAGGREVHFLGGDVPIESILYAIRLRRATTLLLSVTLAQAFPALETTLRAVAMLPEGQRPRVVVGGQAVAGHEDEIRRLGAEAADDQVPADLAGSPERLTQGG